MKIRHHLGVVAATCFLLCLAALAGEVPANEMKTVAVAAFKNGLAFVVKEGEVHLEAGVGDLEPVPNATLGSLWIAPNDPRASLDEVVAHHGVLWKQQNLTLLADVLLANPGKTVTVMDHNQKEYTGEIVGLQDAEKSSARSSSPAISLRDSSYVDLPAPRPAAEFLLLKSEGKLLALNFANITRIVLPADAIFQRSQPEEHKSLQYRIKGASDRATLTMGYLEHGLGWTPSYLISLQDDKKAQITMQAVLVNDAEDLKNTDLFFVVGVPNFAYSNIPSPMALQQSLMEFMQAAARKDDMSSRYSNALMSQMTVGGVVGGLDQAAPSLTSNTQELQGAQEEDLFLYSRKDVTLARGDRATFNVFSDTVSCEHIYEWNLEDQRVDAFGNAQMTAGPTADRTAKESVWHSLRLKNSTKFPWTSAPALVISGTKPLAQDTIPYTPKSAASNLKLTIATDVRASHEENEVGRQRDVQRRHNYNYDQVTVEGKLTIRNYKSKEIRLSIAARVRGTVESQSDEGKSEKLAEAIAVDNPLSRLTWEVTLQPGEEKVIKYRYTIWLRV